MTKLFREREVMVYEFKAIDAIEDGDRCAVTFDENKQFLPTQGGSLSGEAIEYLGNGEYDGLVIKGATRGTVADENADPEAFIDFPPRFEPLREALLDRNCSGCDQALAELMDAALIYNYDTLGDPLDELFTVLESVLRTKKTIKAYLNDTSDTIAEQVTEDLDSLMRGSEPVFNQTIRDYFEPLCDLHHSLVQFRTKLAEFYRSHGDDLESLFQDFPSPEKLREKNTESREYYRTLKNDLLQDRTDHSPLTDFQPERACETLIQPAYDESDWAVLKSLSLVTQIIENFLFRGIFLSNRFDDLLKLIQESIADDENIYRRLTFPREDSDFLLSHIVNVFLISRFVANKLELDQDQRDDLARASLFFDLGMLRVSPSAWRHDDKPTTEQINRIKKHPVYVAEWLDDSYSVFGPSTKSIIRQHHERLDGSGYPRGVGAGELSLADRVLIVVDVYDAMSTNRPHRSAISPDKIITYLKNRSNKFEISVIEVLEQFIGPYPPGTVVQLNTNEIGVSMAGGSDPSKPKVKVIIDSNGDVYDDPEVRDLSDDKNRRIVESVGTRNTPSALLSFISN